MRTLLSFALMLLVLLIVSCSNGSNPVVPIESGEIEEQSNQEIISGIDNNSTSKLNPYRGLFGAWKIHIDPENLTAEIIPARNAKAIGDIFDSDLSQFLTVSPCANCLTISNIFYTDLRNDRILNIEFRMRHPFADLSSRPDLHGFDTRLIMIADGMTAEYTDLTVMMPDGTEEPASIGRDTFSNPDGYTSHYDEVITDERYFIGGTDTPGNLNPYVRFFDDFSTAEFDPLAPAGHNVIPTGSGYSTRTIQFYGEGMGAPTQLFAIADVAYGQSATYQNRDNPQYYLPWFNRTEAWRTEYWIENNNLDESNPASTADVVVQVFDWQHSAAVDAGYPDPSNLSGIPESSSVAHLELLIPDLQNGSIHATVPESGDGSPDNPLQYRLTVTNENMDYGTSFGLLVVHDELYGQAYPDGGRMPIPDLPAGFPYDTLDIRDYAHYNLIAVNIPIATDETPLFENELFIRESEMYTGGGSLKLYPSFFMDETCIRFLYEWDLDYDGVTFDVEETGVPTPWIDFPTEGMHYLGLRVTTNSVPPRQYTYRIPIRVKGVNWDQILASPDPLSSSTRFNRNSAIALTDDNYYLVYTHDSAGERDIMLAIGDNNGSFSTVNVTDASPGTYYNPSICVVESGADEGVYIGFTSWDSGEPDIYSIYGNLDGTGFNPGNISIIANDGALVENNVSLYASDTTLYAYYMGRSVATDGDIYACHREFSELVWTYDSTVNSFVGGDQNYPSIGFSSTHNYLYCAWQDGRDLAGRGTDIFIARSSDFTTFSDEKNITMNHGPILDGYPSVAVFSSQVGVAYQSVDLVALTSNVVVSIMNQSLGNILSYSPFSMGEFHTAPALATSCNGRFTLAYGEYFESIERLDAVVTELYTLEDSWEIYSSKLFDETVGATVTLPAANIFPCVANRTVLDGWAVENFVAFRTLENGETDVTDPAMKMGEIRLVNANSSSDKSLPY